MAIHAVAGEPLNSYIVYRYPDETPILGATFAVVSALRPDGSSFSDLVTITEQGNGVYHVTAPPIAGSGGGIAVSYELWRATLDNQIVEDISGILVGGGVDLNHDRAITTQATFDVTDAARIA